MKKLTLLFTFCSMYMVTFAQQDAAPLSFKPLQGDRTITFGFAGLNVLGLNSPTDPLSNAQAIDLRYFYTDNIAFRAGFGIKNLKTTTTTKNDTTGGNPSIEGENINKTSAFTFGVGVEKHIKTKARRVDPFVGFNVGISSLGDNTITITNTTTQRNGDYTQMMSETVTPGGMAIPIAVNLGFYFYITQGLAFGGEFNLGFVPGSLGGDMTVNSTTTSSVGGVVTTTHTTTTTMNKQKFSALQTFNAGVIELLVKF